jgi:aminopeptidase N
MRTRLPKSFYNSALLASTILVCLAAANCVVVAPAEATIPRWQLDLPDGENSRGLAAISGLPTPPPGVATNQASYDVQSYSLVIRPDFTTETLDGQVHIILTSLVNSLDHVFLDLYDNLQVVRIFTDWGDDQTYTHQNNVIRTPLRTPLGVGESIGLTIVYTGTPQPTGFMGFDFTTTAAGQPILATLSEPYFARSWWPCKDAPDDKATVTVTAFAPEGMHVAGNGLLLGEFPSNGGKYYVWQENYPISTYNVSLAVAEYESWSEVYNSSVSGKSMPIEYHVFPEDRADAEIDFQNTAAIMDLYESYFGEYPFIDDKYGMAEFVWVGAMEHQTMTSYGDFFLTGDQFYERIVGHELAHQWFGNQLTVSDWNEVWLHEGFATYAEALWLEARDGEAAYHAYMNKHSNSCCGFYGPIVPPAQLFADTVYFKGAWVLHMLRKVLGEGVFFQTLRSLPSTPALQYGNFTTEDVQDAFSENSGMDLSWFFQQWIYREGRPTFDMSWTPYPGYPYRVDINIAQTQGGPPYVMPIDVRVITTTESFDTTVWVGGPVNQSSLFASDPILDVQLDPDNWVLKFEAPIATSTTPTVLANAPRLLPNQPNPFNPSTLLRFELPSRAAVKLRILDSRGRIVTVLRPGTLGAGPHSLRWSARDQQGAPLSSGVYRVQLDANGQRSTKSITLLK